MSIKFPPVILGRKWLRQFHGRLAFLASFCKENPHAHKNPPFRGGFWGFLEGGGGSANFIFMGVGILSELRVRPLCKASKLLDGHIA